MRTSSRPLHAVAVAALVLSAACGGKGAPAEDASFTTGHELLQAMHDRYQGTWPPYVTFTQQTVRFPSEGVADTSTWHEALALGKLRIDFEPLEEGNGALFVDGMRYGFHAGSLADSAADTNPLAVLLSDVYLQPVERSAVVLDSLGVKLNLVRRAEWNGTPVWIVGAEEGDSTSAQFWVEADRLLTVRDIQPLGNDRLLDARIGGWQALGGAWVETHLDLLIDGKLFQTEDYSDIRAPEAMDPALFDPARWTPVTEQRYWEGGDST
jgi:hypothetical protein